MYDFTRFEGVLRKIDDSYYLHYEDCFQFVEAQKLNLNFEGEKLFIGDMKIYCDDILTFEVKELISSKSIKKSFGAVKIRFLSLPYISALSRAKKKSRAVKKTAALKQRQLAKEEREIRKSWSSSFDYLESLNLTPLVI